MKDITEMERLKEHVCQTIKTEGRLIPAIVYKGESNTAYLAMAGQFPDDHLSKLKVMYGMGRKIGTELLEQLGLPQEIYFLSEAWMSILPKGKKDWKSEDYVRPSEDPKRIEVVIINSMDVKDTKTIKSNMVIFRIVRDKKGKVMDLVEYEPSGKKKKANSDNVEAKSFLLESFMVGLTKSRKEDKTEENEDFISKVGHFVNDKVSLVNKLPN